MEFTHGPGIWLLNNACFNGKEVIFKVKKNEALLPEPFDCLDELVTFHVGTQNKSAEKMETSPVDQWLLGFNAVRMYDERVYSYMHIEGEYSTRNRKGEFHITSISLGRFKCLKNVFHHIVWKRTNLLEHMNEAFQTEGFHDGIILFSSDSCDFTAIDFSTDRLVKRRQNTKIEEYEVEFVRIPGRGEQIFLVLKGTTTGWTLKYALDSEHIIAF